MACGSPDRQGGVGHVPQTARLRTGADVPTLRARLGPGENGKFPSHMGVPAGGATASDTSRATAPASRTAWVAVAVAVGYAIGAELSWGVFGATVGLAFFPPAGITFAGFVFVRGRRRLLLAGLVMAVEYIVDVRHGLHSSAAVGYAAANVVEPLVGATVALRAVGRDALRDLDDRRGMGGFVLGGLLAGPLVASLVGATVKVLDDPSASWWVSRGSRATGWCPNWPAPMSS